MRRALLTCALLLASCGGGDPPGSPEYREGRFDEAHRLLVTAVDAAGDRASPQLLYDLALAALRAGLAEEAEIHAERAAAAGDDADLRGAAAFVRGSASFARGGLAEVQAQAPEAEPFAFDVAIALVEAARDHWQAAAASRQDWPEARRNVERALLELEDLRRQKVQVERRRRKGPPQVRIRPIPVPVKEKTPGEEEPGPESPGGSGEDSGATPDATAVGTELGPDQVLALLERLAEREREKMSARSARREAGGGGVEKDW